MNSPWVTLRCPGEKKESQMREEVVKKAKEWNAM